MKRRVINIVKYTEFKNNSEVTNFLTELSMLTKLNIIYRKKLISSIEYAKIKQTFKYVA